jgi:hypothetical protein
MVSLTGDITHNSFAVTDASGEWVGRCDTIEQLIRVIDVTTRIEQFA